MSDATTRRTLLTGAAWSIPVIALAVAAPAVAASTETPPPPVPVACQKIKHAGPKGHQWVGIYSDGTTVTMANGDAMSGEFGKLCRAAGSTPGAGDKGQP